MYFRKKRTGGQDSSRVIKRIIAEQIITEQIITGQWWDSSSRVGNNLLLSLTQTVSQHLKKRTGYHRSPVINQTNKPNRSTNDSLQSVLLQTYKQANEWKLYSSIWYMNIVVFSGLISFWLSLSFTGWKRRIVFPVRVHFQKVRYNKNCIIFHYLIILSQIPCSFNTLKPETFCE